MKRLRLLPCILFLAALGSSLASARLSAAPASIEGAFAHAAASLDREIVVEGTVIGVCHSGGRKCFLRDAAAGADGKILRVERTAGLPAFPQELKGDKIRVTGIVRELRYDAPYLDTWEERVKAQLAAAKKKEGDEKCENGCEASLAAEAALKRIADLRTQGAADSRGYVSTYWLDGLKWEVAAPAGE